MLAPLVKLVFKCLTKVTLGSYLMEKSFTLHYQTNIYPNMKGLHPGSISLHACFWNPLPTILTSLSSVKSSVITTIADSVANVFIQRLMLPSSGPVCVHLGWKSDLHRRNSNIKIWIMRWLKMTSFINTLWGEGQTTIITAYTNVFIKVYI